MISFKEFFELIVEGINSSYRIEDPDFYLLKINGGDLRIFPTTQRAYTLCNINRNDNLFVNNQTINDIVSGERTYPVSLGNMIRSDHEYGWFTMYGGVEFSQNDQQIHNTNDVEYRSVFNVAAGPGNSNYNTLLHLFDRDAAGIGPNAVLQEYLCTCTEQLLVKNIENYFRQDLGSNFKNVRILYPHSTKDFNRNVVNSLRRVLPDLLPQQVNNQTVDRLFIPITKKTYGDLPATLTDDPNGNPGLLINRARRMFPALNQAYPGIRAELINELGAENPFKLNHFKNAINRINERDYNYNNLINFLERTGNWKWSYYNDINGVAGKDVIFFDDNYRTASTAIHIINKIRGAGRDQQPETIKVFFGLDIFPTDATTRPGRLFAKYIYFERNPIQAPTAPQAAPRIEFVIADVPRRTREEVRGAVQQIRKILTDTREWGDEGVNFSNDYIEKIYRDLNFNVERAADQLNAEKVKQILRGMEWGKEQKEIVNRLDVDTIRNFINKFPQKDTIKGEELVDLVRDRIYKKVRDTRNREIELSRIRSPRSAARY